MGAISQTIKAGSKAGAKAGAKAATKAIDEKNLSAVKAAGRKAHQEQASARAEKNAEIAEQLAKLPKRSKKASEEFGLYHPVGGGLKLSRPVSGFHATTVPDPMFNPPEIGFISPEQLVKEKAAMFPLVGDRAAAGRYLTHVGEVELERPVRLTGGPLYMDANYNLIDPDQSAAWESGLGRVTALSRQAARAGEGGRPVYGIYTAGSATNTDFNIMGADALIQQLPYSKITKKAEKEFDRAMREGSKAFPPVPNWPGIRSPKAEEMLLDKSNGMLRTKLFDTMGKENFQSMGFPDVAATRKAIIQPELLDVDTHQTGFRLARMDTTGRTIENPLIPSDYPIAMAGQVAGQLDMPVDYKNIFQSHFDARRLMGQPESGDYYSFSRAHPIQYADEEWLNRLMEHRYQLERKIKEGRAKGGLVSPEGIPPIATDLEAEFQQYQVGGAVRRAASAASKVAKKSIPPTFGGSYDNLVLRKAKEEFATTYGMDVGQGLSKDYDFVDINRITPSEKVNEDHVKELMSALKNEDPFNTKVPPIIIDSEGNVLDGHHRVEAAKRLGIKSVPAIEKFEIKNGTKIIDTTEEHKANGGSVESPEGIPPIVNDLEAEFRQYQIGGAIRRAAASAAKKLSKADIKNVASELERSTGALPEITEKYPFIRDASVAEIESIAKGSPVSAYRALSMFEGAPIKPETTPSTSLDPAIPFDLLRQTPVILKGDKFLSPDAVVRTYEGIEPTSTKVFVPSMIKEISERQPEALEMPYRFRSGEKGQVKDVFDIVEKEKELIADVSKLTPKDQFFKSGDGFNQLTYLNVAKDVLSGRWAGAEKFLKYQHFTDKPAAIQHLDEFAKSIRERYGKAEGGSVRLSDDIRSRLAQKMGFAEGGSVEGWKDRLAKKMAAGGAVKMADGGELPQDELAYMAEALSPERESEDSETAKKIRAAIKAGKVIATALPKALVSPVVGLYGTAKSGKYGTREGVVAGEKAMEEFMEPSEETVKELEADPLAMGYLQNIDKFMEELETKYKLPPLMPELYGVATGTRGIVPQVKGAIGKGAAKAKEAVSEVPTLPVGLSMEPVGKPVSQVISEAKPGKMEVYAPANNLGLYSPLEKAALNLKRKEGTGAVFLNDLKTAGVSDEELEYSGLKKILMNSANFKIPKEQVQTWARAQRIPFNVIRSREDANEHKFTFNLPEVIDDEKRIKANMDDIIADFEDIYPGGTEALRQEVMRNFSDAELNDPNILAEIEESVKANMRQEAYDRAYTDYYDNPDYRSYNDFGYEIVGNNDNGYIVKNPSGTPIKIDGRDYAIFNTMEEAQEAAVAHAKRYGILNEREPEFAKYQLPGGSNYQEFWIQVPSSGQRSFTKGHIDEDDIMFHTRTQDRKTLDGKRMLYVDELQSDWHQKGRDFGYYTKQDEEEYQSMLKKMSDIDRQINDVKIKKRELERRLEPQIRQEVSNKYGRQILGWNTDVPASMLMSRLIKNPEYKALVDQDYALVKQKQDVRNAMEKFANMVPDAPFKDKWHELGVKAMLHQAAEDGYERVGFSAAPAHIERWGTEAFAWEKVPEIKNDLEDFRQFVKQTMPESTDEAINLSFGDNKDRDYVYFKKNIIRPGGWRIVAKEQVGGDAGGINLEAEARARGLLKESSGNMVSSKEDLKRIVESTLRDPSEAKVERITNKVWNSMQKQDSGIHEPRKEGMKFFYDEALRKFLQKYAKKIGAEYYESETKVGRGVSEDGGFVDKTEPVYVIEFTPKSKKSALIGQPFKKGGAVKMRRGGPIVSTYDTIPDITDAGQIKLAALEQELRNYA